MIPSVTDPSTALTAGPLLRRFNEAGLLAAADVHVARRLGRLCGEDDERVLLAVALAVRAVRAGAVCIRLDDLGALALPEEETPAAEADDPGWPPLPEWTDAVARSALVGPDGVEHPPVLLVAGRLYLDRYWRDEQLVREEVDRRLSEPPPDLDAERLSASARRLFPHEPDAAQRLAAATAAVSWFTVVTGGPGTGKTTTVARLIAVLQEVAGPGLRVALAAPTGKAARRLEEAVTEELGRLDPADRRRVGSITATTVHRLLGWRAGTGTRFRHDRDHRLPHDVVVIDETSMVSLTLMARLLEALRPQARVVLVGDPDQLASVDAGAVLADLVARPATRPAAAGVPADLLHEHDGERVRPDLARGVVRLARVHRYGGAIADLATAIRLGRGEDALAVLQAGSDDVTLLPTDVDRPGPAALTAVRDQVAEAARAIRRAATAGDVGAALEALASHRLLLAHRRGPCGAGHWSALAEAWVRAAMQAEDDAADGRDADAEPARAPEPFAGPWYPGRPLLVTANDRATGLSNGDTGVLVLGAGPVGSAGDVPGGGHLMAAFGDPAAPVLVPPHRLPAIETVHAMTVHRAQGSQFAAVSLVLPPASSPLLTRELLYTAVTRARVRVLVVGAAEAVLAAVDRPVRRASGLREPR